jgi:integrase
LEAGDQYRAPITFRQLGDRFLAAHQGQASTRAKLAHNLKRLNTILGDLEASDVTAEEVERWLNRQEYAPTYRWALVTVLRQTFNWGIRAKLVSENPAKLISAAKPKRGLNQSPFESWDEVERVADEAGKWGPLVILLVDTGARPGEIFALEHRHVDIAKGVAFLPGSKTAKSRRAVHLTPRGIAAYQAVPRTLRSPYVFNHDGEMVSRKWWWQNVWVPAVKTAGLDARPIYSTRHTFAFFSLMAGVPIADLGVEMGHENVQITSETYGHWSTEMGSRAASLRAAWASATIVEPDTGETKM